MSRRLKSNPFSPEVQSRDRWLSFAICLFLALAIWAVFGQTLHHKFVNYDDNVYVYENPVVIEGLTWHGVGWAFTHSHGSNWHPLTSLSHMLDCYLYGLNSSGHHLTNILLHTATAILFFLTLRSMTGALWPAAFVAAVFAIHPLRVESVAWVAERKDVLSGLFFMLTLWAYAGYVENQNPANKSAFSFLRSPCYWLTLLLFVLGLLSKPMLVTLPLILLLLDYWPLKRFSDSTIQRFNLSRVTRHASPLLEKLPFLLLTAMACATTIWAQKNALITIQALPLFWRIGNALTAYVAYLGQMVWPTSLSVLYPHPGTHLPIWHVGLAVLLLLLISVVVVTERRKHPYLIVGWLWYLGMLVPVIGLIQVGDQARADRYTYLPHIGLTLVVTWGAVTQCASWRHHRAVLGFTAAAIFTSLLVSAYVQTRYWKNSVSLWTHALACSSENYRAHNNLGTTLHDQGKLGEAIQHFERALQLKPDYHSAHVNFGATLETQGKLNEAIQHYERALQLKPNYILAHNNLGVALTKQGKLNEAIQHYERVLQLKPEFADAHYNLANALAAQGKSNEAIQHYERVLQLKPEFADAHYNLGNVLAAQEKLNEAIQHYERALQLKPDDAEACNNLGVALAAQGKSNEAIQHFQQALNLATAQNNNSLAEIIRTRLKSY